MSGPLRSKQGCWTCRLRRKKCDERHPTCSTCDSLSITCYGYGAKPDWMDAGEKEKAMANSIKSVVKHTSRRKGRFGFSVGRSKEKDAPPGDVKLAPKGDVTGLGGGVARGEEASREGSSSAEPQVMGGGSSIGTGASPDTHGTASSNTSYSPLPEPTTASFTTPALAIPPSEAMLLMHFLDNVFPLQYPMYHPTVIAGGRGWFLSLLLRTKPLYHAALALSSYHHGTVVYALARDAACSGRPGLGGIGIGFGSDEAALSGRDMGPWGGGCPAQEKHIQISLKAFQEQIEESRRWMNEQTCPRDTLGFMGCVVQLTYFELFAVRGDTWQIHLQAATSMFRNNYTQQAAKLNLTESLEVISLSELASTRGESLVTEEVASFRFLSGILVWLDILSCVTTGKMPRLLGFHNAIISPESPMKLETIIGCKNWVVMQIGKIAALHEWKMMGLVHGMLKAEDLEDKAVQIRKVIEDGLTSDCLESMSFSELAHIPAVFRPMLVTRIFAHAASVYLHLVVYGFETSSEALRATMAEAMVILRTHTPNDLLGAIVFPLYIFACNAKEEDEDFFRQVFSTSPVLERSMEHRGKLLPLMEKIWHSRRAHGPHGDGTGWSWQNNLALSEYNLLLV